MYPLPRAPRPRPNYAVRRLVAATGALLVLVTLGSLVGRMSGGGGETAATTATTGALTTTTVPLVAPPACDVPEESLPTVFARPEDWFRTLLDPAYALPDQYEPPDLVSAAEANYSAEFRIRSIIAEDLNGLRNAILAEGLPEVALLAAYRSIADQRALYDRRVDELGPAAAADGTARPGHSEHHLGTTVDFRLIGESDVDEAFASTPTGAWLGENAWRYGFVLSYPEGRSDVTCYKFEPWHFRYVGRDLAARVHESGLTLREYFWHWEVSGTEPGVTAVTVTSTTAAEGGDPDAG